MELFSFGIHAGMPIHSIWDRKTIDENYLVNWIFLGKGTPPSEIEAIILEAGRANIKLIVVQVSDTEPLQYQPDYLVVLVDVLDGKINTSTLAKADEIHLNVSYFKKVFEHLIATRPNNMPYLFIKLNKEFDYDIPKAFQGHIRLLP